MSRLRRTKALDIFPTVKVTFKLSCANCGAWVMTEDTYTASLWSAMHHARLACSRSVYGQGTSTPHEEGGTTDARDF